MIEHGIRIEKAKVSLSHFSCVKVMLGPATTTTTRSCLGQQQQQQQQQQQGHAWASNNNNREEKESPKQFASSLGRKVGRSRSVGCGSRSMSFSRGLSERCPRDSGIVQGLEEG
ncbi:hypothetical protein Syun_007404 [Stephania yunnanensis]|uniref:Uncharacterized protein n=1 Tax=Stephania yunnanensis TaxID=152371 RepID=A0AAP0PYN8_9MAGN